MGKALYRKYRPTTLDDVVGQEGIIDTLKGQLKSGNISHAYIFSGPRGCGKTSVARIFAHAVNNFKYELEDSYIDIIEIDAASNNGVDNVRELREKALIAPTEGKYKIYIFDEAHMLSMSASNALLKIIEEPPKHVIFILATTNPDKLPVTILSRAEVYTFKLASPAVMKKHLQMICNQESIKISDAALDIVVHRGGGSFRDSISLLDQVSNLSDGKTEISAESIEKSLGLPSEEKIKQLLANYESGDLTKIPEILKDLVNSGIPAENLANSLVERIVEKPTPQLLNLISRLFTVTSPFADAKLLVAFLGTGVAPIASAPTINTPIPQVSKAPTVQEQTPESTTTVTPPVITSGDFSLDNFYNAVKNTLPVHATRLQKCKFVINGNELNIYPSIKIDHRILSSANNIKALQNQAPNMKILIHDPEESTAPENAISIGENTPKNQELKTEIANISAIMGGVVEEVTDDGTI